MPRKAGGGRPVWVSIPLTIGTIYFGVVLIAFLFQSRLLFFPSADYYRSPEEMGWSYDEVRLAVSDETTIGWYVPALPEFRGVVLFSHGNAGNIADRLESIMIFRNLGFDVLAYDYGGYGESTGKPSEERCYQDIRAMWTYLVEERGIAPERIVLFGRSLGSGPTAQLAMEIDAAGVILESAFRSVPAMAAELYPWLPVRLLARIHFDNEAKIANIEAPLLIIHSVDDDIIPFAHGERLYELANEPKRFLEIRGDHNSGFVSSGALYVDGLAEFLIEVLPNAG